MQGLRSIGDAYQMETRGGYKISEMGGGGGPGNLYSTKTFCIHAQRFPLFLKFWSPPKGGGGGGSPHGR